jgi:DNA-sulfur modification-associated
VLRQAIRVDDVHRIKRPGLGYLYTGRVTIGSLYLGLTQGLIRYAPKYQRGFRNTKNVEEEEYERLVEIYDDRLVLDRRRASAIAVKYLMALNGSVDRLLFNPDVVWNARKDSHHPEPDYEPDRRRLEVYTTLTIPDSGHRHLAYYFLGLWKDNNDRIPKEVEIDKDGERVGREQIAQWLERFDPFDDDESSVLVQVFNLPTEQEGRLFDEYNDEGKRASNAVAIDLYKDKTPSRRFITRLMELSPIFARSEIETRSNTIGTGSRKLTTNATLDAAAKPFTRLLLDLENNDAHAYDDLTRFIAAFFEEWAVFYPEYLPTAAADERWKLRQRSFALSNIIFFPLVRMAFHFWEQYQAASQDWRRAKEWKDALKRLAGTIEVPGERGKVVQVEVMARDTYPTAHDGNPAWRETILVPRYDRRGTVVGWMLSSTRNTREAAFHYLCEVAGVRFDRASARGHRSSSVA